MSTSENRKKTGLVMVRATPEDLAVLRARAADVGLPLSGYMLAAGLGHRIHGKSNDHLIQELRLLAAQQKQLCAAHGGALTPEYRAVLVQILAAIERIGD